MSAKRLSLPAEQQEPREESDVEDDFNISEDEEGGIRIGDIYIPPPIPPHCSAESKGPRLIIETIENNNFKSYAGKVVLGPFHHRFTAIIGPNGSGKSNVIDSLLFVFGFRANKIRCKKISTLLHNSAEHPNTSMCSVAVCFRQIIDREDGSCEPVPNSKIIIKRTAFRDNSSFYTINGQRVQFMEVSKLLKQHHVDLKHNRFLILQGEVESIAMMKNKGHTPNECGMLEYLEDIIGTTRYKTPLVQLDELVEQLTEERTAKHNRAKMAEREMKDMEPHFNAAVLYLKLENENVRTKNLRIQKYLSEKLKAIECYTKEQEQVSGELKEHDDAAEAMRKQREEKELIVQDETARVDSLRAEKESIQKQLQTAHTNFMEVQETMRSTNCRRRCNKTALEEHLEELKEFQRVPVRNQREIDECERMIKNLTKQKPAMEEQLQRNYTLLEQETKPLIENREQLETQMIELQRNVDEAKGSLALSESELKILRHDETTAARKYETMRTAYEQSELSLQEMRTTLNEMTLRLPEIQTEIVTKTQELKTMQRTEEQLNAKLMPIKMEINEREAMWSKNRALDYLMREKSEGKIPGILGRLGDLGAIDSKYDVAISTACGRLDNIVVDTVDTAQECMERLKRYAVGRASFIALEKVEHLKCQLGPIQTPEQAPRLYDLVRVEDERVLPAFFFALRNTLVGNDLEQGMRIAYGAPRYRVVTLKGDLIESSGTMSGGSRTQISGKMGTKVQTRTGQPAPSSLIMHKALAEMQKQAEQLQSEINYAQEMQGRLECNLHSLRASQQKHETEIPKINITIKSLEEQLPRILTFMETQRVRMEQTTTDPDKVSELEKAIAEKRQTLEESETAANSVMQMIADVKQKIDTIHGDKLKSVQTKINAIVTYMNKLDGDVAKLKVEVNTAERNITKSEEQIEQIRAEILQAQDQIVALSKERERFDDQSEKFTNLLQEVNAKIDSVMAQSSEKHLEIAALKQREEESQFHRIEIEQKLEAVLSKLSAVQTQIPYWRDKLNPLSLNIIPGMAPESVPPLKTYTEEELATYTLQDIQYKESVQEEMMKKRPNLSCVTEYMEKREAYVNFVTVLEDITLKRNEMRQLYDDVRKKRHNEFMQGFQTITRKLKELYQMITQGGDAELELVDSMDPFTEGVSFSVRPPKKSWKNISNLSGGEKTLSSLSLVFALHYYKPSPLYFMDEIDAALDFKNISIVAHYIKERTKNAQFIIISLRSNMFELSDYLVGIYKVRDCTDSLTIKNTQIKVPFAHTITQSQSPQQPTNNIS